MSLLHLSGKIAVCSILSFIFVSLDSGLRLLLLVAAPWKCFGEVMGSIATYEYSGEYRVKVLLHDQFSHKLSNLWLKKSVIRAIFQLGICVCLFPGFEVVQASMLISLFYRFCIWELVALSQSF